MQPLNRFLIEAMTAIGQNSCGLLTHLITQEVVVKVAARRGDMWNSTQNTLWKIVELCSASLWICKTFFFSIFSKGWEFTESRNLRNLSSTTIHTDYRRVIFLKLCVFYVLWVIFSSIFDETSFYRRICGTFVVTKITLS